MRLAAKLVSLLVLGVILVVAIEAYVSILRAVATFQDEMKRDSNQFGRALKDLVEVVWRADGEQRVLQMVEDANQEEPQIDVRIVWLDAARNSPNGPRASDETLQDVRHGKSRSVVETDELGRDFLYTYAPLSVEPARSAALEIARPLDALDKFRRDTIMRVCIVAGALTTVSAISVVALGIAFVGRPLNQLVEMTRRVGRGDLSQPLVLPYHDEMGELAVALNDMCEHLTAAREHLRAETEARIQALEQLRHADRLTTVGRLAAGMAHELGTPLNVAAARAADMICEEASLPSVDASARIVKAQVEKMTKIVRQLLDFARQRRSPHKSQENLTRLTTQTAEIVGTLAKKQHVEIRVESNPDPLFAKLDGGQIQQLLTNLLVNAIHAMPEGGLILVHLHRVSARSPHASAPEDISCVRIDVRDEGTGIAEEHLPQIFDPFFTTKDIGEGTGLGLSIAYGIVHEHGGWIEVDSRRNQGACFSIFLPEKDEP